MLDEYFPAAQTVQVVAPALGEYVPAAQSVQELAPAAEYVPAVQLSVQTCTVSLWSSSRPEVKTRNHHRSWGSRWLQLLRTVFERNRTNERALLLNFEKDRVPTAREWKHSIFSSWTQIPVTIGPARSGTRECEG